MAENDVVIQISVKGVDQIGRDLNKAKAQFDNFGQQMNKGSIVQGVAIGTVLGNAVTGAFSVAIGALQSIANAALGAVSASLTKAADLQQIGVSIEALLGNADTARIMLNDLQNLAERTPFNLTNLAEYSKQLIAAGTAAEDVVPTIEALGDITSAVGIDKFDALIFALSQTRNALQFAGNDLLQFRNAGVNVETIFKQKFNKTVLEVNNSIKDGTITYKEAEDAILSLGRAGGKFDNLAAKQSRTFTGLTSNLEDLRDKFLGLIGGYDLLNNRVVEGGLLDTLSKQMSGLLETLNTPEMQSRLASIGTQLSKTFGTFVNEILPKLIEQLPQLIEQAGNFISSIDPSQIKDRVEEFVQTLSTIRDILEVLWNVAGLVFNSMRFNIELVTMSIETQVNNWGILYNTISGNVAEVERLQQRNEQLKQRGVENLKAIADSGEALIKVLQRTRNESERVEFSLANISRMSVAQGGGLAALANFAKTQKFASGGIVGGYSRSGDRVPVMANSGEMILNGNQQNALMNLLNKLASRPQQVITANFQSNGNRSDRQESNLFLQTLANV